MSSPTEILAHARILIADDEEMNLHPLQRILTLVGANNVRVTTDPRDILPLYREFRPDILLLDLHMPEMDGFDVLRELKSVVPDTVNFPVLMMTGDLSVEAKRRALAAGAKDFLTKPVDSVEVVLRVSNLLESRFWQLQASSQNVLLDEQVRERTGQLEEALARLHESQGRVIKQERLSALGVMASGIAHDFNNVLATVLGYGELLLDHPERAEYVQVIIKAARDAREIVQRLREFYRTRREGAPHGEVWLNAVVHDAIALTQPKWRSQTHAQGIQITVRPELSEVPPITANAAEMREMLTNLIFNAVDAMPHGGVLRIRTRQDGDAVVLEVADSGVGMDEKTREKCLEPFFTTKGTHGTGLGLAVVYGILQRHNASLDITSDAGIGTIVSMRFPIAAELGSAPAEIEEAPASERAFRILAVDNEPVMCTLVGELLGTDGHVVDAATGGGAALEKYRENDYDLVLTDEAMPGMNGQQLAGVIKQLAPAKPVILLTGFGDTVREAGCSAAVDLVVDKPATLSELRRAISQVMSPVLAAQREPVSIVAA